MGYRVPSAEQVYNYVFRTDEEGARHLTDRFSWSILLLNDSSPICREFLLKFCVDLCFRTADRVRFVFFSDVPERLIEGGVRWSKRPLGRLDAVLDALAYPFRRAAKVDFEDWPWRELRPSALHPLVNVDDIEREVTRECKEFTAMPGSQSALQLAQRLGIGRHVPCILAFTDVGALQVHVLPFEGRTADEIYVRIRGWIDNFYEINRETIDRWQFVEKEIVSLASAADSSVSAVREWRNRRLADWKTLRRLAELISPLSQDPWLAQKQIAALRWDSGVPPALSGPFCNFHDKLEYFDSKERASSSLKGLSERLSALSRSNAIRSFIVGLSKKNLEHVSDATASILSEAASALSAPPPARPARPSTALLDWWRDASTSLFSQNWFLRMRRSLVGLSLEKSHDVSGVSEKCHQDYFVFLDTAQRLPIARSPEDCADTLLTALAGHYGRASDSGAWIEATTGARVVLLRRLRELRASAPEWLLRSCPDLPLGECMPLGVGQRDKTSLESFLASTPRLNAVLQEHEASWRAEQGADGEEEERVHLHYKERVGRALEEDARRLSTVVNDRASALAAFRTFLGTRRADLEARVAMLDARREGQRPARIDLGTAERLARALDQYDDSVRNIVYPHTHDPLVIELRTEMDLSQAAGVTLRHPPRTAPDRFKETLTEAVAADRQADDQWHQARREAQQWTPVAALGDALQAALSAARLLEVLGVFPGDVIAQKVSHVVTQTRPRILLDALTRLELEGLLGHLRQRDGARMAARDIAAMSTDELHADVLTSLGLPAEDEHVDDAASPLGQAADEMNAADRLRAKIAQNMFDVFMAHSSADKPAILNVGRLLRRRGLYPWIDVEQVAPGRWFQDVIQSAIRHVKAAAVFFGEGGLGRWQALELRAFVERCASSGIPLIPVLLPGVAQVPVELVFMQGLHHVKFERTVFEKEALDNLEWGIEGVRPAV